MNQECYPKVSVVIAAYNSERYLRRAVTSIFETLYPNLEVVIVDDGSGDATFRIASEIRKEHDSVVVLAQHPAAANRGVSESRNLGMRYSSGEYICFLDADDTMQRHRFEKATRVLSEQPTVDGVYEVASIIVEDPCQRESWEHVGRFGIIRPLEQRELLTSLIHGRPWATSAILFRRELLARTGVFDERLFVAEDCNLWMRMVVAGRIVPGWLDRPVSNYHRREGSLYVKAIERKYDYLKALIKFLKWTEVRPEYEDMARLARLEVRRWLDNTFIQCRKSGQLRLLLQVASFAALRKPSLICSLRTVAHVICGVIGR